MPQYGDAKRKGPATWTVRQSLLPSRVLFGDRVSLHIDSQRFAATNLGI